MPEEEKKPSEVKKVIEIEDVLLGSAITASGAVFLLLVILFGSNSDVVKTVKTSASKVISPKFFSKED